MTSDPSAPAHSQGHAWLTGQLLALVFLAACVAWVWHELEYFIPQAVYAASFGFREALLSRLGGQVAAFLAAVVVAHALLGLASSGLALLTRAAFPRASATSWLTAGWFALLALLVVGANTTAFPTSIFAGQESAWRAPVAGLLPAAWLALGLTAAVIGLAVLAFRRSGWHWTPLRASAVAAAALLAAWMYWPVHTIATPVAGPEPNVVIIGIDSLRNDLLIPRRGPADVPNIRAFLAEARRFEDAITPLARTYASWTSILTGRHPVATNARYNLMPRELVRVGDSLGTALKARGYRATYATDETRFANFDATFGFDALIKPPTGAIDFLASYAGDLPLVNLAAATPAGALLFPANHANRAANVTYRPRDFVRRLERGLRPEGPAFLAIHLTLGHWPYAWAGQPVPTRPDAYRTSYAAAIQAVDTQFAEVLGVLERAGVLDNAIVVLLSDHGEALGADDDTLIRRTGTAQQIWESLWGHGTSVLSPHQYQVLLAVRAYGRARLPGPERDYDWPVTLEDLRPTLEELATGTAPSGTDGISLVPYLADPERAVTLQDRIRFTETDLNTASLRAGRIVAAAIAEEAADFYELDPDSGWVQLRAARLPELIARKQRAALSRDALLAYLPEQDGQPAQLLFSTRREPFPEALEGPVEGWQDAEARRLQAALWGHYGADPGMPAGVP